MQYSADSSAFTPTMSDNFVTPVKGIIKGLETGIKLAKRISKSASAAPVFSAQALQASESAQKLQKSLERTSQAIIEAYEQNAGQCGEPFTKALVENQSILSKLKECRSDLLEQVNDCQDVDDDLEAFNPTAFASLVEQSQKCSNECINIFNGLRDELLQANLQRFKLDEKTKDDRVQLSSMRESAPNMRKPVPSPSNPSSPVPIAPLEINRTALAVQAPPIEPVKPRSPWAIDSPSQFDLGAPITPMSASLGSYPPRPLITDLSPSSALPDQSVRFIPKEIVNYRLSANEEFLERRRQSRLIFQNELRRSVVSIEEDRVSQVFDNQSPILEHSAMTSSPIDGRGSRLSGSGYDTLMTRQRSQGQASQGTRSSRTSSILHERPRPERQDRQDSQDSIFGLRAAPLSPPLSEHRTSGNETWGTLATTLQVPGFGNGVEDGLMPVGGVDRENGLILANEDQIVHQPTPTASMKSIDYPMTQNSSFYKFGGFCEGSKAMIRGEPGLKVVKRPSGHYSATVSARCIKCSYEVGWNDVEKDRLMDRAGVYGNSGIRWRQRFISKCHLKAHSIDEPIYACIFCIEEHKTVEEMDATVFFSVTQLFRHLATHSRPLPNIAGITALYGFQEPTVMDFDLHFTTMEPKLHTYCMAEIAPKVAARASALAITTNHPKRNNRDPEGNPVLHFAAGARVVGVTYPDRFHGQWCIGYHDGERGSFPASAIQLEMPVKEDVLMNAQSSLVAFAKWDFKPKDAKDGSWLKFSKGDKIQCIGYSFQDQWCWSGQTSKGKWGLFPAAFVESLQESAKLGSSPGSVRTGGLGLSGRMPSFPIGRHRSSKHERSASIKSASSGGSPVVQMQPGLEVVHSYGGNTGSISSAWRG